MSAAEREPTITVPPPVRQPAYDAIYALIRSLGDHMPASPINRNALIWRAVETALDAVDYDEVRGEVERMRATMLRLRDMADNWERPKRFSGDPQGQFDSGYYNALIDVRRVADALDTAGTAPAAGGEAAR